MKLATIAPWTVVLALTACNDERTLPDEEVESCDIDAPRRILAEAPSWSLDAGWSGFDYALAGERVLYSLAAAPPLGPKESFLQDICSGPAEQVLAAAHGLRTTSIRDSSVGPILFAFDAEGRLHVADRLDVPGADVPHPIEGVPMSDDPTRLLAMEDHGERGLYFTQIDQPYSEERPSGAAGIGARTRSVWAYSGEPDEAAKLLATDVVRFTPVDDAGVRVLVLSDDGRARWIDRDTLAEAPIRDGVRWLTRTKIGERTHYLLQEIGDGVSERVLLRDAETGEERQVTINPFADMAFGQDPEHPAAGRVLDAPVLGLLGPDGTIVEAYDPATLAPLAIPAHVGLAEVWKAPHVGLVLNDAGEHVRVLWDPATGETLEWFRGTEAEAEALTHTEWRDGKIRFHADNPDGSQQIGEIDPATGAREVLLSRLGSALAWFDDGRIVHTFEVEEGEAWQVVLSDPGTGSSVVLLDRVQQPRVDVARERLFYVDREADEPGLWVRPLPPTLRAGAGPAEPRADRTAR